MTIFHGLRRIGVDRLALDAAMAAFRHAGVDATWSVMAAGVTYAHFRLGTGAAAVNGWLAVNTWVASRSSQLAGLAWAAMDPKWVARLLAALQPPLAAGPGPHMPQANIRFVGVCTALTPRELPAIACAEGDLLVDGAFALEGGLPGQGLADIAHWRLPLRICLGRVALSHSLLARARPGDVVLLDDLQPRGCSAQTPLFSLNITQETLIVEDIFESMASLDADIDTDMDSDGAAVPGLDLHGLPVHVDIVLMRMETTVGALAAMQPGSTLPVSDEAYRAIRLEVGGRCIARGELVQVGEHKLGIQLHHVARRR